MSTLQGPFYEHMIGSTSAVYADLVMAGVRIEIGLKLGKIQVGGSSGSSGGSEKQFNTYPKKREGDARVVYSHRGRREDRQHQQINVVSILVNAPPEQRPNTMPQQKR